MKLTDNIDVHRLLKSCHQYWKGALILFGFVILWKVTPAADVSKPKLNYSAAGSVSIESPKN